MNEIEVIQSLLPVLIPILLVQVGFQIYCIRDLIKQNKVRFNNKIIWAVIILLFNVLGGILYLSFGRVEE